MEKELSEALLPIARLRPTVSRLDSPSTAQG